MKIVLLIWLLSEQSFAAFDVSKAMNEAFGFAGKTVGGWLVLAIFIVFFFAYITRKKK